MRAFAIMKPHLPEFCIDYTKSTQEVYKKVVYDAVRAMNDVQILAYCRHDPMENEMPTWVPDWRQQRRSSLLCNLLDLKETASFIPVLTERVMLNSILPAIILGSEDLWRAESNL